MATALKMAPPPCNVRPGDLVTHRWWRPGHTRTVKAVFLETVNVPGPCWIGIVIDDANQEETYHGFDAAELIIVAEGR
jgi:hypothetical protein